MGFLLRLAGTNRCFDGGIYVFPWSIEYHPGPGGGDEGRLACTSNLLVWFAVGWMVQRIIRPNVAIQRRYSGCIGVVHSHLFIFNGGDCVKSVIPVPRSDTIR